MGYRGDERPRILIIDSYDSFTYNLAALVKRAIPSCEIFIIKNDETSYEKLCCALPSFSAVVVGPGPGSPLLDADIGVIKDLWKISQDLLLPIFGVCLGLQSLAVEHGATLKRLAVVKHGQVSTLHHTDDPLYDGIPAQSSVVRYHSLYIDPEPSNTIQALAWADDGKPNGRVLMALKHSSKPFWAVQYHPESVCTDNSGLKLMQNFWKLACRWRDERYMTEVKDNSAFSGLAARIWPPSLPKTMPHERYPPLDIMSHRLAAPGLTIPKICEIMGVHKANTDFVLLDSVVHPGQFAIIGCLHANSIRIEYSIKENSVTLLQGDVRQDEYLGTTGIWEWLSVFMKSKKTLEGDRSIPFWGGLVGYLSYQLGVENLHCKADSRRIATSRFPDANLVFIERSIVYDTKTQEIVIQTILPEDETWLRHMTSIIRRSTVSNQDRIPSRPPTSVLADVVYPNKSQYIEKIQKAQEYLFSGDSYELCLTAQTEIRLAKVMGPASQRSWEIYKNVRNSNPAPYAAYLRLGPTIVISSSPERFLSYSRPPGQQLQLRPIKGTVRKGCGMSRERAEEILSSPKEVGENLMIVDLIRHDLHGIVGTGVDVKTFCGIEEYETVWQLVSVIEGSQAAPCLENTQGELGPEDDELGWKVLKNSLPPGSMTGAPKKRSVEILDTLEEENRGIYSGVLGYWCVGGGGDWSVVIRSCFKVDEEHPAFSASRSGVEADFDTWYVGAGGAITALSDPLEEWEEMVVKLQSVLRAFRTE